MTVTAITLLESKAAEATQTTQIPSTNVITILDKFTAQNNDTVANTLTVNMVPAAGAAGGANILVVKTLQASETYTFPEVVGHILNKNSALSTIASKAGVINIRASGRVIS